MTAPLSFTTSAILNQAWKVLQKHWAFLLGAWLIVLIISGFSAGLQTIAKEDPGVLSLLYLGFQALSVWLGVGFMRLMLKVVRDEPVQLSELWSGGEYFLQYFIGMLVVSVVIFVGFLLLIVPGIIWSFHYIFTQYILADEKLSFSEAMAQSKAMSRGIEWNLAGFALAILGLNLLACLPFFLGLIVTIPLTTLAGYVLYVDLRRQYLTGLTPAATSQALPTSVEPNALPEATK